MSTDRSYEIFRKQRDNTTVLVEAVKGIEEAKKRVQQLDELGQGEHFVFDPVKNAVVDPTQPGKSKDPFAP